MIVHHLKARNFMRFAELDITGIPEKGAIAIVGENETGKSAIGEMVSFALFGETPRARRETAFRVVRWGASEARVELGFALAGMGRYAVVREMDADGLSSATLYGGEADEILAEGPARVAAEVRSLLGFEADEFRYSFYLAQNELDIVDGSAAPRARDVIFRMLGIHALETAAGETARERDELLARQREAAGELALTAGLLENIAYDPEENERLEALHRDLDAERKTLEAGVAEMDGTLESLAGVQEEHGAVTAELARLGREVKYRVLRDELDAVTGRAGGLYRGLKDAQEGRELVRDRARREAETLGERARRVRSFHEKLSELRNLVRLQQERRRSDLSEEGREEGTNLAGLCDGVEADLARARKGFLLGVVEAVLAAAVAAFFGVALHSVASGGEYLPFLSLEGLPSDLRTGLAGLGTAVVGLLALLLVLKAVYQRKALVRKAQIAAKTRQQLATARLEAEALGRIDFGAVSTIRQAQPHIAEKDIRQSIREMGEAFDDFLEAGLDAEREAERTEQARLAAEDELRRLQDELHQRSALLAFIERRARSLFEDVEGLEETWMNASAVEPEEDLPDAESAVYELFDRLQNLRSVFVGECSEEDAPDAPPARRWEALKERLSSFASLLADALGYRGGAKTVRFDAFLEKAGAETPQRFLRTLSEELARLRSAFPSAEEIAGRAAKAREDRERARARLAGVASRLDSVEREKERLAPRHRKYEELRSRREELEAQAGPLAHDIAVRETLLELFRGTVDNIKNRLGPEIGRFIGRTIAEITRNRYGNASVTEDLDIRIFSREKNGLITLDEVSGGTRDQVLLCLRLALSQALVRARMGVDRGQFLFLDEPVSSFDEERSRSFLDLVRTFSPNFQQVFVTLHLVGAAPESYERVVRTTLDKDVLKVSLA